MDDHLNAFQELVNQTISLEVPLANKVLALMIISLLDNWETLMVTLGVSAPHGKQLT